MASRKTQTKVTLNAKLSNVDIQAMRWDGQDAFIEGAPIKFGATGYAAQPTGGNTSFETVYINFVDSTRSDVEFRQGNPYDPALGSLHIDSGGLAGIRGSGIDVALPRECWDGGVLPAVGEGVFVDGTSKLFVTEAVAALSLYYGIIERIENDRAHFFFTSRPFAANPAT